jgi:hypothetical protein
LCLLLGPLTSLEAADEPPPRWANGRPIRGKVVEATAEGLTLETPKGQRTFEWSRLSTGTRYRYEPGFKEKFPERLKKPGKTDEKK